MIVDDALVDRMVGVGGKGSHVVDEGFKAEIPSLGRVDVDADAEFFQLWDNSRQFF